MISDSKFNNALAQLHLDDIVNECLQGKAQSVVEIKGGTTFEDSQALIDFMGQYAKSSGFKVCRKVTHSKNDSGVPRMVQFYCNYKNTGMSHKRNTDCKFIVTGVLGKNGKFLISQKAVLCLDHGHPLEKVNITACEKELKCYESNLSGEEKSTIIQFGVDVSLSKLGCILNRCFPYEYHLDLLKCMKKKAQDSTNGNDPDGMQALMHLGHAILDKGEIFEYQVRDDMHIDHIFIRFPGMEAYNIKYGDFIVIDGTHGTNAYGLTSIPLSLVDTFGKTIIAAILIVPSENSTSIINGMKAVNIGSEGGVLLSDGGLCFAIIAEEFIMIH